MRFPRIAAPGGDDFARAIETFLTKLESRAQLRQQPIELPRYAKANLPSATKPGEMIFVNDDVGGSTPAFSDGTNWRRVADRAIIA